MHMPKDARGAAKGFTLIELMIVVVIIAVMATAAVASYKRFSRRARIQEAIAFLADIRIKQESYYQTYHRYVCSATNCGADDTDFWPKDMDWHTLTVAWGIDCTKAGDIAAHPGWCALGAGYRSDEMATFGFLVVARNPAVPVVPPVAYIKNPNQDWWYARARADFDNDGEFSNIYLSSELREPFLDNELE